MFRKKSAFFGVPQMIHGYLKCFFFQNAVVKGKKQVLLYKMFGIIFEKKKIFS